MTGNTNVVKLRDWQIRRYIYRTQAKLSENATLGEQRNHLFNWALISSQNDVVCCLPFSDFGLPTVP